jgi:hypothetical protein
MLKSYRQEVHVQANVGVDAVTGDAEQGRVMRQERGVVWGVAAPHEDNLQIFFDVLQHFVLVAAEALQPGVEIFH